MASEMSGYPRASFGLKKAFLASFTFLVVAALCAANAAAAEFAITGARIFDGSKVIESGSVVVRDGRIAAVGENLPLPDGIDVVDGTGKTLLPGLIDCHTHSWGDALERAAVFGVTTVLDMFTEPGWAAERRQEQAAGKADGRADLLSAGFLATAPGGHGTQYGIEVPTLTAAEQAEKWVADRVAEGSDYIKIVIEDGALWGRPLATLDAPTVTAVAAAARAHDQLALAHVTTSASARMALDAEVDGLVHLFRDAEASAEWIAAAARLELFVVPTLTVLESTAGLASGASLVEDPRLAPYLKGSETANLRQSFPAGDASIEVAFATLRALDEAGVRILAGTDAPNPGTAHGASMHRELELLVRAGLAPATVLAAATSTAADVFGLDDRGKIVPGRRADLLLVEGNPLADVTATRAIVAVWKAGRAIERPEVEAATSRASYGPGPLADFDDGELSAAFGFGWSESTDGMMDGKSTIELEVVVGGADGSANALELTGELQQGFAYPWAGAMFLAGEAPMAPIDLSAATELAFWTRGDPGEYRVMAFAESLGRMPTQQNFEVTEEWRQIVLPLAGFRGADPKGLTGFLWSGGSKLGGFRLVIDQIELRK